MTLLPVNLLIAFAWATAAGDYSFSTLALGFVSGFFALYAFAEFYGGTDYQRRVFAVLRLAVGFVYELVVSSFQVAGAVIAPSRLKRSRFVTMPLDVESDFAIMLTANMITLPPGTLSVDVSPDRKSLLVHSMFADDAEEAVRGCKEGIERRVLRVVR